MLRKLRIKFIAIIMASVAVVLAVVFTGICMSEYQRTMSSVDMALDNTLNRAVEGMGVMPGFDLAQGSFSSESFGPPNGPNSQGGVQPSSGAASSGSVDFPRDGKRNENAASDGANGQFQGPRIGGEGREERDVVPVAVYQVTQTTDTTELQIVPGFTTAEIDENVLTSASERVLAANDGRGTLGDLGLHYQKRTVETVTYVAFADTTTTANWQSLAVTLIIAALVVLAVFFVIAWFLSKWALRPVSEAWESQRQFVADASHELKTPLTVVLANTSILLKHPESSIASQSQWIESTQIEAESMQGLVNEMLELAQVESRTNVQHEPFDFSDLVDGLVLQFESVAFERGCMLESSIAENITVDGDVQRLRKMVSTLIENALKYVDDSGEVDVNLASDGKTATLSIRNSGSTISAEDLPHIFDRFYRTDKARTSGTGGYGLGLAIAREIAREHEGDITCQSAPQQGTTFTVTLPVE